MFSVTIAAQSSNPFQHISIEKDGIPYTDFTDIIQDTTGYMWLGTKESLLRYDGYEVKLYEENPADSTTLRNGNVQKLFIDTQATLWVGTQAGISRYQPNCDCFINYSLTDNEELTYLDTAFKETDFGFTNETVFAITENQAGQLWVAMYGGGLFQYNRAQDVFTPILNDPQRADFVGNDLISTLLADDQDNLWIGKHTTNSTTTGGLIRYHLPTGSFKRFFHDPQNQHSLIHNHITALTQDEAGRLYIGSNLSGLQEYDYNQQRFIRYDYDIDNPTAFHAPVAKGAVDDERMGVSIIQRDRNGGLWVATYGESLYHFAEDETLTKYNSASNTISPFVNNFFKSFYEDRQGHIWLTTSQSGGLYQLNTHQRKFTRYPQIKGAQRSCESIMEADIVWIGTMGDGLYRLNRKTGDYTQFSPDANDPKSIAHSFVRAVHVTADGTLWLGLGDGGYGGNESGKGGLDHFDPATGVIKHYTFERKDKPEFNWAIYAIHEDSLGRIWFDAGPGGIYRSDRQKQNFKPYLIPNAADSEFWLVSDTNRKNLWVTDFTKNILYRYDIQQDAFISIVEGYSSEALLEDEKGYWIASFKNGLLHYDPHTQQVRKYGKQQGLNDNQTVEIHSTEAGIYWVATRKGISKFTAATETFENAGLPRGYYHPMWLKSKDEQLFFGSDEGTIAFYPDEINGNPHPPKVLINDLQISGEVYPLHDLDKNATIEVGYQQNDFNFSYTALHYSKPNENKYQYKLSPFDNDWIDGGTQRNVRYTNLESGEYTFQVKASNSDGIWTSKATTLAFQIHPAWWTRWWFYVLTVSLLGSISYWFYRFQLSRKLAVERSERLAEINRLKTGLYNNITHEFRTPLTVILGLTSDLKTEATNTWNDAIRPLELIERNGKKLLQLINEMLALAKLESGHLQLEQLQIDVIPFLKYLCESFQSLAARNNISLAVEAEIDELIMDVDKDKLTTIVANLLSNAIKFTSKNGSVIVRLNQGKTAAQEFFIVEITDNGKGIAATELPHIFDRFYQADNRSVRRYEGTGIGLALTKELVELMNGKIEVKSKLGKGSTFSVQLPITKSAPLITAPQPSILTPQAESFDQIQTTQNAPTNLPIVLMIEDNPDVAFYIKSCLHETYQILYATDGQIGIDMALQHIPDLIISDVMMPRKDGFEVCQTLKADERTNHIPIILLTAKATIEDRLTGLKQGADVYLAKPFEKEELLVRLRKLLELRQLLQHKYSSQLLPIAATKTIKEVEDPFIKKAKAIVLENIADEAFNSPQLEKALHLSRSQVYRKIKAVTGYSTAIFIRHLRLQEAVKLLQSTSLSISEIAYQVGFKSPVYFSQVFKETFNQSPTDLRN